MLLRQSVLFRRAVPAFFRSSHTATAPLIQIPVVSPSLPSFRARLEKLLQCKQYTKFQSILQQREKEGFSVGSKERNLFSSKIHYAYQKKDFHWVLELYSFMATYELSPTLSAYNVLLESCLQLRQFQRGKSIFEAMQMSQVVPDLHTYTTLINLYAKEQNLDGAITAYLDMKDEEIEPNSLTFTSLMSACAQKRDKETAIQLSCVLKQMEQDGIPINLITYNIVIDMYAKMGDKENIEFLLTQMKRSGLKPDVITYTSMIRIFTDLDQISNHLQKMREENVEPNVGTYTAILRACAILNPKKGIDWFTEMQACGILPNSQTYKALVSLLKVHDVATRTKELNTYLAALTTNQNAAQVTYITYLQAMEQNGFPPDVVSYNIILKVLEKHLSPVSAQAWYQQMVDKKIEPDYYTCGHFARVFRKFGSKGTKSTKPNAWTMFEKRQKELDPHKQIKRE